MSLVVSTPDPPKNSKHTSVNEAESQHNPNKQKKTQWTCYQQNKCPIRDAVAGRVPSILVCHFNRRKMKCPDVGRGEKMKMWYTDGDIWRCLNVSLDQSLLYYFMLKSDSSVWILRLFIRGLDFQRGIWQSSRELIVRKSTPIVIWHCKMWFKLLWMQWPAVFSPFTDKTVCKSRQKWARLILLPDVSVIA